MPTDAEPTATFWGVFLYVPDDTPFLLAMFRSWTEAYEYCEAESADGQGAAMVPLRITAQFARDASRDEEDHDELCRLDDHLAEHVAPLFAVDDADDEDAEQRHLDITNHPNRADRTDDDAVRTMLNRFDAGPGKGRPQ